MALAHRILIPVLASAWLACAGRAADTPGVDVHGVEGRPVAFGAGIEDRQPLHSGVLAVPANVLAVSVVDDVDGDGQLDLGTERTMPCDRKHGAWYCGPFSGRVVARVADGVIREVRVTSELAIERCSAQRCERVQLSGVGVNRTLSECSTPAERLVVLEPDGGRHDIALDGTRPGARWRVSFVGRGQDVVYSLAPDDADAPWAVVGARVLQHSESGEMAPVAADAMLSGGGTGVKLSVDGADVPECRAAEQCRRFVGIAERVGGTQQPGLRIDYIAEQLIPVPLTEGIEP